jgi:hypothetical protein
MRAEEGSGIKRRPLSGLAFAFDGDEMFHGHRIAGWSAGVLFQ